MKEKIRWVSRTVKETTCNCTCINLETKEVYQKTVIVTSKIKSFDDAMEACRKIIEAESGIRCANVDSYHTDLKRYGVTEEDFLSSDKLQELPLLKTAKADTEDDEEE